MGKSQSARCHPCSRSHGAPGWAPGSGGLGGVKPQDTDGRPRGRVGANRRNQALFLSARCLIFFFKWLNLLKINFNK